MEIREYDKSLGAYTLPNGLREALEGKSLEEQIPYFRTATYCHYSNTFWSERTEKGNLRRIDEDGEVKEIIVDNGIIVGVMVKDYNFSKNIPCFVEEGVCTYYACDNNGAGYKEREDYFYLFAVANND
ncbi:MAG: hypothetical protein IJF11_00660 [Clostridia bacterium]|nr:hypothetical protein [Clostridia bacterium]